MARNTYEFAVSIITFCLPARGLNSHNGSLVAINATDHFTTRVGKKTCLLFLPVQTAKDYVHCYTC